MQTSNKDSTEGVRIARTHNERVPIGCVSVRHNLCERSQKEWSHLPNRRGSEGSHVLKLGRMSRNVKNAVLNTVKQC